MSKEKLQELIGVAKQFLSIIEKSTIKDKEIEILVKSGISDMESSGIDAEKNIEDSFIIETIMMHVKANFGNTSATEKELSQKRYRNNLNKLTMCSEFKKGESNV